MFISRQYRRRLETGLVLTLMMATTLLQAAEKIDVHSLTVQEADLNASKTVILQQGRDIIYTSSEEKSRDNTMILRPSSGQALNVTKFGAKMVFDSYVIFVSQPF